MLNWGNGSKLVAGLTAVAVLAGTGALALSARQSVTARGQYTNQLDRLKADLATARQAGYSPDEWQPIAGEVALLGPPATLLAQFEPGYYAGLADQARKLREQLLAAEAKDELTARGDLDQQLAAARAGLGDPVAAELPDPQLASLRAQVDAAAAEGSAAKVIKDLRKAAADARAAAQAAQSALAAQQAEDATLQQAAAALVQQPAATLRQAGAQALAGGRNDATVAAYEEAAGRFPAAAQEDATYWRLEHYAARLSSSDQQQLALGVAAVQRYSASIHSLLLANLGAQHVIVSFQDQHVWAYEGSKLVMDSAVTTGIRGDSAFGTDFGPMKVLHKDHPWKMHSPWPQGSQYWYPDTVVQWTVFFTWSGEAFHDASWQPDSTLGPGSQYSVGTRSHGCVHLPYSLAEWMFDWADIGTAVDIYPGDGSPVAAQLAQMTTDDQGNPKSLG